MSGSTTAQEAAGWLTPERLHRHVRNYILVRMGLILLVSFGIALQGYFWEPVLDLQSTARVRALVVLTLGAMGLSAAGLLVAMPTRRLAPMQLLVDGAAITSVVLLTGGARSPLGAFYALSVVAAAWLVPPRGVLLTAGAYGAISAGLALAEGQGLLQSGASAVELVNLTGATTVRVFGFFLAALLAGRLAELLREAELRLQSERGRSLALRQDLAQVVDSLRSGLALFDPDGRLRAANQIALELFPELNTRPAQEAIPRWAEGVDGPWEVSTGGEEGQGRHLLLCRSPMQGGGSVLTIEDISRLRRLERNMRQQERLSEVGRFAAGVAHEVRNPLTALSGAVQLLQVNEEDRPLQEIIQREVERINRLVSDFLQAARPPDLRLEPTDLRALIAEILEAFGQDPRYTGRVQVAADLAPVPLASVDPDQLRQLVWNILLNAAQAQPEGGTIGVRLSAEGEGLSLAVRDEGVGIPEEDLPRIFDPFFTTRSAGTGLGLATVKRIVDAHCGVVRVRSRPGLGTTFAFWLPLRAPAPGAA